MKLNRFKKLNPILLISIATLMLFLAFIFSIGTLVIAQRVDSNARKIAKIENIDNNRLNLQALKSCERLKIVRGEANANSRTLYTLAKQIQISSLKNAKALKQSGTFNKKQYKERIKIANEYGKVASNTVWVPQTNCHEAVFHPDTYVTPTAKHFHFKVKLFN